MDAGEVMKNVVEQTNNVTTGNETNSEPETVPPNRFTLLFKLLKSLAYTTNAHPICTLFFGLAI